jgi:multidrug resistance efflux pump
MNSRDDALRGLYRAPSYAERAEAELAEAQAEVRRLTRELKKERQKLAETSEAYTKTVSNLVRTVQENTVLRYENERFKQGRNGMDDVLINPFRVGITRFEIAAIRKAMARIHHPDAGGETARMQAWNVLLDQMEREL